MALALASGPSASLCFHLSSRASTCHRYTARRSDGGNSSGTSSAHRLSTFSASCWSWMIVKNLGRLCPQGAVVSLSACCKRTKEIGRLLRRNSKSYHFHDGPLRLSH